MSIVAKNPFTGRTRALHGPTHQAIAVTPDDANDLANVCRAVVVTTAGLLHCTFADDTVPVSVPVQPGIVYQFMLSRVWLSGTTCGNVIALY